MLPRREFLLPPNQIFVASPIKEARDAPRRSPSWSRWRSPCPDLPDRAFRELKVWIRFRLRPFSIRSAALARSRASIAYCRGMDVVKQSLTMLVSPDAGHGGVVKWSSSMGRMSPLAPISCASRRRLARCLVGSPIRDVERDLVLETLANTCGNRTESARLLGMSLRTLRNRITEYAADGIEVPRHATQSAP
jgi:hypothetical protein